VSAVVDVAFGFDAARFAAISAAARQAAFAHRKWCT
jgi:hypothetical protein